MASVAFDDLSLARLRRVRSHIDIALAGATELAADLAKAEVDAGKAEVDKAIEELKKARSKVANI